MSREPERGSSPTILLTGASGFVGRHAAVALSVAGFRVRGLSRSATRARREVPELDWIEGDLRCEASMRAALQGVASAVYLYHAIGTSRDYCERESRVADSFRRIADECGVERIVYLGGVQPVKPTSRHLESRRRTGEILRQARATTIELRASMVIGCGSASFRIVRDLAVNLPVLALPPWLDRRSCPIAICDVAAAIAVACRMRCEGSACFELPGPEPLSHRALIGCISAPLGTRIIEPRLSAVTAKLAALGIAVVSRVTPSLSRELVFGLESDLLPTERVFWDQLDKPALRPLRHAIVDALVDESALTSPAPETRRRIEAKTVEWLRRAGSSAIGGVAGRA
jgi:nucleoside-diphosphate-sugar epimerase